MDRRSTLPSATLRVYEYSDSDEDIILDHTKTMAEAAPVPADDSLKSVFGSALSLLSGGSPSDSQSSHSGSSGKKSKRKTRKSSPNSSFWKFANKGLSKSSESLLHTGSSSDSSPRISTERLALGVEVSQDLDCESSHKIFEPNGMDEDGNESKNFERNSKLTSSVRSNSCPNYDAVIQKSVRPDTQKWAKLKTAQSDTNITKHKLKGTSEGSLRNIIGMFNSSKPSNIEYAQFSSSTRDDTALQEPGLTPDHILTFLTDEHTLDQKKRQGDIYEIIQTERSHCKLITELSKLFHQKNYKVIIGKDVALQDHIDKIFNEHYSFLINLKNKQGDGVFIDKIGETLLTFLTNVQDSMLDQSYGLLSHYCKRSMEEIPTATPQCVTAVPLRLTKFQTQLDSLLKHSKDEAQEEKDFVSQSYAKVKEILRSVNSIVDELEKDVFIRNLHVKIDSRSTMMFNGTKFTRDELLNGRHLIHHEQVDIFHNSQKSTNVQLLLFDDVLIFVQEISWNKYQFYSTHSEKNVVPLYSWVVRDNAGTKNSIFLFSTKMGMAMLEIYTQNCSTRNIIHTKLCDAIKAAEEKEWRMRQAMRDELQNAIELSNETFAQKVEDCTKEATLRKTLTSLERRQDFKSNVHKAQELLMVSLKKAANAGSVLLDEFKSNALTLKMSANCGSETLLHSIEKYLTEEQSFLATAVKLGELSENLQSPTSLGETFRFEQKLEELRAHQALVVEEKRRNELEMQAEKAALETKAKSLETLKCKLEEKEKDLAEREQRLMQKQKLIDKYLGACVSRANKLTIYREITNEELIEILQKYDEAGHEFPIQKKNMEEKQHEVSPTCKNRTATLTPMVSMPNLLSSHKSTHPAHFDESDSKSNFSIETANKLVGYTGSAVSCTALEYPKAEDFVRGTTNFLKVQHDEGTANAGYKMSVKQRFQAVRSTMMRGKKVKAPKELPPVACGPKGLPPVTCAPNGLSPYANSYKNGTRSPNSEPSKQIKQQAGIVSFASAVIDRKGRPMNVKQKLPMKLAVVSP